MPSISTCPSPLSLVAAAATNAFLRVSINASGQAAIAGIAVLGVGTAINGAALGANCPVALFNNGQTHIGQATEAIAVGDTVYTAAAGQYSKTAGGGAIVAGIARTAAGAANDQFEFVPIRVA
jgi:hypothetical protein